MQHRIKQETTSRVRSLRSNITGVERLLGRLIRSTQRDGYRFRRQHPIGRYIADFPCLDKKRVVDLGGFARQRQM